MGKGAQARTPTLPYPQPGIWGCYLSKGTMELPPAHDELGLLLANALQAAQIPG